MPLKRPFYFLLTTILLTGLAPILASPARADLTPLATREMHEVFAGTSSGISILIDSTDINVSMSSVLITDPATNNTFELQDVTVDDGAGGGLSFDNSPESLLTLDVATETTTGVGTLNMSFPLVSPFTFAAQHTVVDGHDLGILTVRDLWWEQTDLSMAGHDDASTGVDMALASKGSFGELSLTYNEAGQSAGLHGTYWGGSVAGAPEDPASWVFEGALQIGDLADNPATLDVVGPDIILNLPMSGTVRVEDVVIGGQSFGPVAFDGLQVHSLRVTLPSPAL